MPADIKQTIGFDVSNAITNLDKLGNSISNVSGRLTRFGGNLSRFNAVVSGGASNLTVANSSVQQFGTSLRNVEGHVGRLTTSVELLSRIVFTQLVIKGLRLAERALFDAAKGAAELQVQLAQIRTISDGVFDSIPAIGGAVEGLSRQLGTPQLEVARGLYEAIGNQIGDTSDELLRFSRTSGQFAVATLTDNTDAMRLLSTIHNGLQIDLSRTDEVASKLNKTIDVGAITGKELAEELGRVIPQAKLLGVSLEEVLAAYATMTRNGLSAAESSTRLLGVMTGLQKPSENLQRILASLNLTSGETAVATLGFRDTLASITSEADRLNLPLAKVFTNIRGLAGAAILGEQGLEAFGRDLESIKTTATDLNQQRFNIVFDTDAKQVEREVNNLRIEMGKLGSELLHLTVQGFEFSGGAENITSALKVATPIVLGYTAQVLAMAAANRAASASSVKLAGALGAFGKLGLAVGVAKGIGDFIGGAFDDRRLEAVRSISAANERLVNLFAKGEDERLSAARETDSAIVASALDAARQQVAAFSTANDALIRDEKRLLSVASDQLQRFTAVREDFARELQRAADASAKAIEQSQARVTGFRFDIGQRKFDQSLSRLSDPDQLNRTLARAQTLARQASADLRKAQSSQQIDAASKLFDQAQRAGEGAKTIAERLDNRILENRAVETLNRLTADRIKAEEQLQKIQLRRSSLAESEAKKQSLAVDEIKASAKALLDNLPTVGLDPKEQAARADVRQDALRKIVDAGFSQADISLTESLGLARLAAEMERNPIPLTFNVETAVTQIQAGMSRAFADFKLSVGVDVEGLEQAIGRTLTSPDQIAAGLTEARTEADALRTSLSQIDVERQRATLGLAAEVRALLESTNKFANQASRAGGLILGVSPDDAARGVQLIRDFRAEATRLSQSASITTEDVSKLFSKVESLNQIQQTAGLQFLGDGGGFAADIDALSEVTEKLLAVARLPQAAPADVARLEQLESAIRSSQTASTAIETSLTRGATILETSINRAADRLERALSVTPTQPQGFAFGGSTRGRDTVPAMLQPGEFVVNQQASQRWFSDLQRMNAGVSPQFRNSGGSVTNVGDISVTVNEAASPALTARDIASQLRREIRRGAVRGF